MGVRSWSVDRSPCENGSRPHTRPITPHSAEVAVPLTAEGHRRASSLPPVTYAGEYVTNQRDLVGAAAVRTVMPARIPPSAACRPRRSDQARMKQPRRGVHLGPVGLPGEYDSLLP